MRISSNIELVATADNCGKQTLFSRTDATVDLLESAGLESGYQVVTASDPADFDFSEFTQVDGLFVEAAGDVVLTLTLATGALELPLFCGNSTAARAQSTHAGRSCRFFYEGPVTALSVRLGAAATADVQVVCAAWGR